MSVQQIAKLSGVPSAPMSPSKVKLLRTAQEYRQMAHSFRRKLVVAQRRCSDLSKLANKRFVDMVDELCISPVTRQIVKAEMRNFNRKPNGREWTLSDKLFSLSIFKRSARAYRFIKTYVLLPHENTLKELLTQIPVEPGISEAFLSLLAEKVKHGHSSDLDCVVSFDEMFLRGSLFFNKGKNIVEGFENYGHRGRTNRVADHALVFMAEGLNSKWTLPVAYFFVSKTCPSQMLKLLIKDVVKALFGIGFNVLGTVSDQGPTNRGAISELRQESGGDDILYSVDDHRLVHVWDMPHILKNVRNNLLTSNLEFDDGKVAKWRHLIEFFKLDESMYQTSTLTYKHLNPQGRDKMRVPYAAQGLSSSVSKSIKTFHALSDGTKLGHCLPFADLCEDVDKFFDLCNGPRVGETLDPKKFRLNVTEGSPHHEEWNVIISSLQKWTFIRKADGVRHKPPCVTGWIENIKSFRVLWHRVKTGLGVLKLRHLNQDPVENLFCLVRQCGGSSSDLTTRQFTAALKTCVITRFSSTVKGKNCLDDGSYFVSDLQSVLSKNLQATGDKAPGVSECLIRGETPSKRKTSVVSDAFERQGPTKLWASVLPSITMDLKCDVCLSLLTTREKSRDTMFATISSLDLFPSPLLVTLFIKTQAAFELQWKRSLFKDKIVEVVVSICQSVNFDALFCPDHVSSSLKLMFLEKTADQLIRNKVSVVNKSFKEKVIRHTRQITGSKNCNGLRDFEEELELHQHDLQLLLGPMSTTGCANLLIFFLCVFFLIHFGLD